MKFTFLPLTLLATTVLSSSIAPACEEHQPPAKPKESTRLRSFKGWELYSWQDKSQLWSFSLLKGTNRTKSLDEVMAPKSAIGGVESLKKQLSRLAQGEFVSWNHALIPHKGKLKIPSQKVIEEVAAFSREQKLEFSKP